MAYKRFHKLHEDLEEFQDIEPAFYDTDGSPVYEAPYGFLRGEILAKNDVAALRLYHSNPKNDIWYEHYENPHWHPVFVATQCGSMEALRAMLEIYVTDPRYVEPLEDYMKRIRFSPIHAACAVADRDLVMWLLNHDPPLATLHDHNVGYGLGETPLLKAAEGLGNIHIDLRCTESGISQINKHEEFICFLLDQGCSVLDSNAYSQGPYGEGYDPIQGPQLEKTVLGAVMPNASYKLVSRLLEAADIHAQQAWRGDNPWSHTYVYGDVIHTTALHIAARYWNTEAIRALLDHSGISAAEMVSKQDDHGHIPLHWALAGPALERCTEQQDPESRQKNLTEYLVSQRAECIKMLLESNPETINIRDHKGATCFNYAMRTEADLQTVFTTVKMLLDTKPEPSILSARNPAGTTALQDAMTYHCRRVGSSLHDEQFKELIETLIGHGANTHLCLHELCRQSWEEPITLALIDRLLESNDINDTDAAGCTAMHYLVLHLDQADAFHHLLKLGANVTITNLKGNSPLHEVIRGTMIARPAAGGGRDPRPRDTPLKTIREWLKIMEEAGGSMDQPNAAGKTPGKLLDELTERFSRSWARADRIQAQGGRGRGRG